MCFDWAASVPLRRVTDEDRGGAVRGDDEQRQAVKE